MSEMDPPADCFPDVNSEEEEEEEPGPDISGKESNEATERVESGSGEFQPEGATTSGLLDEWQAETEPREPQL